MLVLLELLHLLVLLVLLELLYLLDVLVSLEVLLLLEMLVLLETLVLLEMLDLVEMLDLPINYFQRLTLESWYTNLEQTPINGCQQLSAPYKRLIRDENETDKRTFNRPTKFRLRPI